MPTFSIRPTFVAGGKNFGQTKNIECNGVEVVDPPAKIPVAKSGSLTTRTDNDTGVVTLSGGHGIITGDRCDIYWEVAGVKGKRTGMAATVAVNAVTLDGGAGDNLPAALSTIIVAVAQEFPLSFAGDDLRAIAFYSPVRALFVLAASDDTAHHVQNHADDAGMATGWDEDNGVTNPVAGDPIAKVFMSHADTTSSQIMRVGVGT